MPALMRPTEGTNSRKATAACSISSFRCASQSVGILRSLTSCAAMKVLPEPTGETKSGWLGKAAFTAAMARTWYSRDSLFTTGLLPAVRGKEGCPAHG